jgi:RNA polymerase sigma-70 factor (ECF subfamily)
VARFLVGVLRTVPLGFFAHPARVNGGPGAVGYADGYPTGVVALDVAEGRIFGVRIVVNPDKLRTILPSSPSL